MKYNRKKNYYPVPFSVNISITELCPLKCRYCFRPYNQEVELELNKIYQYVEELSMIGTRYIMFSGGEPLMYEKLPQAIKYTKEKGLKTHISTSGAGLTKKMIKELSDSGLDCSHISLNGSKKHIHELTRDGFNETMKALEILAEASVPTAINWVANQRNSLDLPELIKLGKYYNVKYINLLANKKSNFGQVLFPLSYEDLNFIKQYVLENSEFLVIESCFYQLSMMVNPQKKKSVEHGCRAGRFYMAISARNEYSPCPHFYRTEIDYGSIKEYWDNDNDLIDMRQMLKSNQLFTCKKCINHSVCTPCLVEMFDKNSLKCSLYCEGGK